MFWTLVTMDVIVAWKVVKTPLARTNPGCVSVEFWVNWPTMVPAALIPKAISAPVSPGFAGGRAVKLFVLVSNEKALLLEEPTTTLLSLMPLALASGSLFRFSVENVPFGLRTKFVNRVGVVALSELNPTTAPLLLMALTVVPPPLLPGPSKLVNTNSARAEDDSRAARPVKPAAMRAIAVVTFRTLDCPGHWYAWLGSGRRSRGLVARPSSIEGSVQKEKRRSTATLHRKIGAERKAVERRFSCVSSVIWGTVSGSRLTRGPGVK